MTPRDTAPTGLCLVCHGEKPRVCVECVRDLAVRHFWVSARHPEQVPPGDPGCSLCVVGPRAYCADCALDEATRIRDHHLRQAHGGRLVARWPNVDPLGIGHTARGLELAARMVTDRGHEDAAVAVRELADGMREGVQALQDPAADLNREQVADRVRALFLPDQDEAGAGSSDSAPGSEGQPHTGS